MESVEAAEEMKDTPNKDPVLWLWRGQLGAVGGAAIVGRYLEKSNI